MIAVAGDIACPAATPDGCQERATAGLVEAMQPAAVLVLGDLQSGSGELASFRAVYDKSWGRFKSITKPAVGNHEYSTAGARGYAAYFGAAAGPRGQYWYSFDIGGWHLIALNSNCRSVGGCQAGSPQERWLRADLAAHPARCTLAFWHHSRYSSGIHGSDPGYDAFWQALADAGAELVLGGHDHHYERFAEERGIRQFVVGTGGETLYPVLGLEKGSEQRNVTNYGVLRLDLLADGYRWRFVPVAGSTYTDTGIGRCH